ncbi:helix-turn-helix domain-containing protein [Kitasatospora purpeofusca]|uniref:helix-turn-helix domain-containing protein n=1 Tax=Kitasatospora purpeofusca TaxID=67352 RepID=UPI0036C5F1F5
MGNVHGAQSIGKAARILLALSEAGPSGVSEIARRTGTAKTTTHRILACLLEEGLVKRTPHGYVAIPMKTPTTVAIEVLRGVSIPYLVEFYAATSLPVGIAVRKANGVAFLHMIYLPRQREVVWQKKTETLQAAGAAHLILEAYTYLTGRISPTVDYDTAAPILRRGTAHSTTPAATAVAVPVLSDRRTAIAALSALVPPPLAHELDRTERTLRITAANIAHTLTQRATWTPAATPRF